MLTLRRLQRLFKGFKSSHGVSRRYLVFGFVSFVVTYFFVVTSNNGLHVREVSYARSPSRSDLNIVPDVNHQDFCEVRTKFVPNNVGSEPRTTNKFAPATTLSDTELIYWFTISNPLDIVVSHCEGDISWIQQFRCHQNLRVYIYLKCGNSESAFALSTKSCVQLVNLTAQESAKPEGTLRHFISTNYYSLNLTYFCKDREQIGARLNKVPTGPIRRLRLGIAALGGNGGFVHTAQDPIQLDRYMLSDLLTLLLGLGNTSKVPRSAYQRCGPSFPFTPCESHWWFRLMDTRDNKDWLSSALSWRTTIQHFKRDAHYYSFFQAFRNDNPDNSDVVNGGFSKDERGFASSTRQDTDSFCSLYSTFTCRPCTNPWIPARTQFLVSRRRMQSLPRQLYGDNSSLFMEYTWGLLFNCFIPYDLHREGKFPFIRCIDP